MSDVRPRHLVHTCNPKVQDEYAKYVSCSDHNSSNSDIPLNLSITIRVVSLCALSEPSFCTVCERVIVPMGGMSVTPFSIGKTTDPAAVCRATLIPGQEA